LLAADDEVDALLALVLPTAATGDLVAAIPRSSTGCRGWRPPPGTCGS
jgi:hypothetical protein